MHETYPSRLSRGAALVAFTTAVVTLAGWTFGLDVLKSILPGQVAMNPTTAVALLCAAGSLWLQAVHRSRSLAQALAVVALAFGLLKISALLGGPDLGLDRLLFRDKLVAEPALPNVMAPNTALCFTMLGATLWLHARGRRARLAQALALGVLAVAFFALLGYLYDLVRFYRVAAYIPMAFNTAVAFTALALGALAMHRREGLISVVSSPAAGGYLARRLLPAAIAVPVVVGGLRLWGERAGIYSIETGVLVMVGASVLLMTGLVWWTARAVDRADRERLAAVDELRRQAVQIRDLYDHAPCGYHSLDENGVYVEINDTELAWLGYDREEVVGRLRFSDMMTQSSRARFSFEFARFKADGAIHGVEFDLVRKDGTAFPVSLSATAAYDESGRYLRSRATMFDITKRRSLEEALRESSAFLESIVENLPLMVFVKKAADLRFVKFNRAGEELVGHSRGELIGRNDYDFFPREQADFFTAKDREVLREGEVVDIAEEPIQTAHRGLRILHTRKIPLRGPDGEPRFLLGISEDITERKRAEERIHQLNKELEAFSYSVSHDLRAPLRAIVGFSQALLEDHVDQLDVVGQRLLERVCDGGRRMGRLIDDLLELSRLSRAEMRRVPVDLSGLAREVERGLRDAEPDRRVEVTVAPGLSAQGDPQLLRVALQNLLGNAWKYTGKKERARIELGALGANGAPPTFFVKDDGAGFDARYADKLFAPFQRLHAAHEFAGTGIGLATVQRIVQRHGGRIWAEGMVDEGATFYFTLEEE